MADNSTKPKQRGLTSFFKKASDIDSESAAQSSTRSDSYWSLHETKAAKSTEMKKSVKREFRDNWLKEYYPWLEFDVKIVIRRVKTTLLHQAVPILDIQPLFIIPDDPLYFKQRFISDPPFPSKNFVPPETLENLCIYLNSIYTVFLRL